MLIAAACTASDATLLLHGQPISVASMSARDSSHVADHRHEGRERPRALLPRPTKSPRMCVYSYAGRNGYRTRRRTIGAMFDQRRQVVGYQNNAFGDINIGSVGHVGSPAQLLEQLARLRDQIATAERSGSLDKDLADATDEQLAKARQLAERPQADKRLIIGRLNAARSLVESVAAAGGALAGLATAIGELAQRIQPHS